MKKVLCPECGKLVVPEITEEDREVVLRGEKFTVKSTMPKCSECGSEFLMAGVENDSFTLAYDEFRKKHKLLYPAEITAIREMYGLSPKPFAKLFGWGELTVYKYEKGALQDNAHDEVLRFINDPENMKMIYDKNLKDNLDPGERDAFETTLSKLCAKINPYARIINLKFSYKPDEFSGNRPFDLARTANLILKIIKCSVKKSLYEVQLLKCLFYLDFFYYKGNKISMTGLQYANGPFGPIPNDYHDLLSYMLGNKMLNMQVEFFDNREGHLYTAVAEPDESVFSGLEQTLISEICGKLTPMGSKKLSDKTHKEVQGWKETASGQLISYKYADRLSSL